MLIKLSELRWFGARRYGDSHTPCAPEKSRAGWGCGEKTDASSGGSSSYFAQRRPHEANLTEGMSNVVAHATTAHLQALLALDLSPFPLLAIGLGGSHRALSQLLAPFQFVEKSLQV